MEQQRETQVIEKNKVFKVSELLERLDDKSPRFKVKDQFYETKKKNILNE